MKFSLSWLKDYLDTEASVAEISATLNAIGIEVEGIEDPAAKLAGFRVARVLTAAPHPNADKLQVLTVDTGEGDPLQVVCGAPNARAGLVGVLGTAGAVVPANGMVLKVAAVRGVESNGMMCSSRELELGDDHAGIIELPADAPVGTPFAQFHGADPVFDVAITPNRPDCMGVYGIARDLAAAGIGALKPISVLAMDGAFPCPVEIRTEDPAGCPAFYGRAIRGVKNGPSPNWLQERLKSAGQRPISALVDLTNYLMLGFGRPAHAYDLAKLSGAVVARLARDGESVTALNGKDYVLDAGMTVIADAAGVHDIAGIMGGEHSGCTEETTDVLLEVAYFDPQAIAATGRKLNLTSDARSRFERGVDPLFLDTGLEMLTRLIVETCGGEASAVVRAGQPPRETASVSYDPALAERVEEIARVVGVPLDYLELEVTESMLLGDADLALRTLTALRAMGVKIAIDDFGTGYSSLSYLRRLPLDKLKLDQSFIRDAGQNEGDVAITRAIIAMAHSLKLSVVAEGVETQAQIDLLLSLGCTMVQGFMLGRPLPAAATAKLLRESITNPDAVATVRSDASWNAILQASSR